MSEPIEQTTDAVDEAPAQEPKPQAPEVDWKAKAREWERRAKDNKAAADELAELRESQKTEAEKVADRLAVAEKRAADAEAKALRAEIATAKGVPAELLNGSTAEELEAHADQLLAFRGEAPKRPAAPPASGQGNVGVSTDQQRQVTRSELNSMSTTEINKALREGRLKDVLSGN